MSIAQNDRTPQGGYPPDEVVRTTVEAVNERGARLPQYGWCNFSSYGNVTRPEAGQEVEVALRPGKNGGYWIQRLRVLAGGPPGSDAEFGAGEDDLDPATMGYDAHAYQPGPGRGSAAPRPVAAKPVSAKGTPSRASLRASALAAAAHFHSARTESTEDDVYETAVRFMAFLDDDGGEA